MADLAGSPTADAPAPPERLGTTAREGGVAAVLVAERRAIETTLRRFGVRPAEAPELVAEAVFAVAPAEDAAPADPAMAGRLLRALEILGARRRREGGEEASAADAGDRHANSFAAALSAVRRSRRELALRLERERREAPEHVGAALGKPSEADAAALATYGAVEHVLAGAAAAWVDDAHRARDLAGIAVAAVRRLDPVVYGAAALADLEARSLATLGNARRVIGDLAGAEADFAEASRLLADGSRDPRVRAELVRLVAVLRRTEGRSAESLRLLDQAAALYRWLGDAHLEARVLLQRASLFEHDDPAEAAALAARAVARLDLAREPRLELVALHNLVHYRHAAGDLDGSAALLPRVTVVAERLGGRLDRLRLRWLAARIAADRDDPAAGAELAAVRDAFAGEEMPLDAVLASLDLAAHLLARGRTAEARRVAEELAPLVACRAVDREVLAALLVFREAARRDRATEALARTTAAALRRQPAASRPARPS